MDADGETRGLQISGLCATAYQPLPAGTPVGTESRLHVEILAASTLLTRSEGSMTARGSHRRYTPVASDRTECWYTLEHMFLRKTCVLVDAEPHAGSCGPRWAN
jgi:hypothetical protein